MAKDKTNSQITDEDNILTDSENSLSSDQLIGEDTDDMSADLGDAVQDSQEPSKEDLEELNGNFVEPEEDYGGVLDTQTSLSDEQDVNEEEINDNTLDEVEDMKGTRITEDDDSDEVFVTNLEDAEDDLKDEEKKNALIDEIEDEKFDDEFEEDEE